MGWGLTRGVDGCKHIVDWGDDWSGLCTLKSLKDGGLRRGKNYVLVGCNCEYADLA